MAVVGLWLAEAYSRPPMRLKGRGIIHLPTLWTIIFVGPMAFVSMLLAPLPPVSVLGISVAYATLQMGIILFNTAEDFPEDRAASVRTTIVALGLRRGISLAAVLIGAGGVSLAAVLVSRAPVGSGWFAAAVCSLAIIVTVAVARAAHVRSRLSGDLPHDLALVRRTARLVPIALTLVAWTSLAAAYAALRAATQ
jgi:1,4-dihydroxy-2-naphthoate octaprenyltransferase